MIFGNVCKQGCNLSAQKEKMKLHFFDVMKMDFQASRQQNEGHLH